MHDDNTSTMIHLITGIVIALLIAGAVFAFWSLASRFIQKGSDKLSGLASTMEEEDVAKYDGAVVSGTEVISAIKQLQNQDLCITVNNGHTTTAYIYTDTTLQSKSTATLADAQKKNNVSTVYINPSSKYLGTIVRDSTAGTNGAFVGLTFDVQ